MDWTALGYGVALTVVVGSVLAFLAQWRDVRTERAADTARRRLDERNPRVARRQIGPEIGRHIDRAA
jgi:hypothetical protein